MKKLVTVVGATVLITFSAAAQSETPKMEVAVDYSFAHFNPGTNIFHTANINGGGGAFVVNFGDWVGVKADFQGYGSNTYTHTFLAGTTLPNGTVLVNNYQSNVQANLFTYTFGPVIKKHTGVFQPFVEVLLGAAHSNGYANLRKNLDIVSGSNNNNGFAMVVGGGIDLRVNHTITIRPGEADYLLTRFGFNYHPPAGSGFPTLSTQNQNSFRYLAGVDFTFGGNK